MWRELIERTCPKCTFAPPAAGQSLDDLEAVLGVALPPELRSVLLESNGVSDEYGHGILPAEQIIARNLELRADTEYNDLYMPFDHLLCVAAVGNGDMFFFPVQGNGKINRPDVFVWNQESDTRQWAANNLEHFVIKWYSGQLQF